MTSLNPTHGATDLPAAERAGSEARALGARAAHPYLQFDALMLLFNIANDRGDLETAAARVAEAVPLAANKRRHRDSVARRLCGRKLVESMVARTKWRPVSSGCFGDHIASGCWP